MKNSNEINKKNEFQYLIKSVIALDIFAIILLIIQIIIRDITYPLHIILILFNIFIFIYIKVKKSNSKR